MAEPIAIVLNMLPPGARQRLVQHLAEALADEGDPRGELALLIIAESLVDGLERYARLTSIARDVVVFDGPGLFKEDGTLNTLKRTMADEKLSRDVQRILANWDNIDDAAIIRPRTVAALLGVHEDTVWRRTRVGTLPPIVKVSARVSGFRFGDLKATLRTFAETTLA